MLVRSYHSVVEHLTDPKGDCYLPMANKNLLLFYGEQCKTMKNVYSTFLMLLENSAKKILCFLEHRRIFVDAKLIVETGYCHD